MNKFSWSHVVGLVLSVCAAVYGAAYDPTNKLHLAIFGGGGVVAGLGITIAKLFHDKGVSVASIQAAGSALAQKLPALESDLSTVSSFVEHEWPATQKIVEGLQNRADAVDKQLAAVPTVAQAADAVVARLAQNAATTAASQAATPAG